MRFLLILNPTSGGGRNVGKLKKVLKYFRKKGDEVVVHRTTGPGDAEATARERCVEGFDAVIGAGGDGTIHEVVGGLKGTETPLGILPWGTGNVFAREMGLPRRVKALCKVIRQGRRVSLDLGLADGRPFLLMASAGLDAYALGQMRGFEGKRLWGMGAYVLAGLDAFVRYPNPDIKVVFDDGRKDTGSFVLVSNTRLYGAYFVFQPSSDPTDGLLDVFVFRDSGRWKFLGMFAQLVWHNLMAPRSRRPPSFLSRHGVYKVTGLRILPGRSLSVQADGEFLEGGASAIVVSKGALKVMLPKRLFRPSKPS